MGETAPRDKGTPAEVHFFGGRRGKFFQAGAKLNLPVYLAGLAQERLADFASSQRVELSTLANGC